MKATKLIIATILMSLGISVSAQNQPQTECANPEKKECRMKDKWQKMSEKLMLTDAQKAAIEPIYKEYCNELAALAPKCEMKDCDKKDAKKEECNKDCKNCDKKECVKKGGKREKPELTDAQINEQTLKMFDTERKRIDINEKYYKKFSETLSARQARALLDSGKPQMMGNRMQPMQGKPQMGAQPMQRQKGERNGNRQMLKMEKKPSRENTQQN